MNSFTRKILFTIFIGIFAFLSFDFARAAFNPEINYQGKLTNTSDTPVTDGFYNMQFRLCADSTCGSVLWTEVRTSTDHVAVTNGLFSVLLGSVTPLDSVDFNQPVYLEVQVGTEVLLPRKLLGTVPSAFEANKIDGLTSSSLAKVASDETITGAWNFNNVLNVNNLLSVTANSASPALSIIQSGAGAGIEVGNGSVTTSIYSGSTSTFNYGVTFATAGGAVTIGTSDMISSTDKLSVAGNISVTGDVNISGSYLVNGVSVALPSATTGQTIRYGGSGWEATSSLFVDNNGNIGIGTTTPNARLQVIGTSNFSDVATFSSTTNVYGLLNNPGRVLNPVQVGEISAGGDASINNPFSIFISGQYAYVTDANSSSLEILDISNPTSPVHVGKISDSLMGNASTVFVSGKYAYVTSQLGGDNNAGGLSVIDISNPASPVKVGDFQNGINGVVNFTEPTSLYVSGKYAYVAVPGTSRLVILDISNPAKPVYASEVVDGGSYALGGANSVFVSGKFAYVTAASSSALNVIDVSDPTNPTFVSKVTVSDIGAGLDVPSSVYISGNYAYVTAVHSASLEIIDISNSALPTHAGILGNGGQVALDGPISVVVSGKYAYVASYLSEAIEIVDISNPTLPSHVAKLVDGQNGTVMAVPRSLFLSGNYLYACGLVSGITGGVGVFDVSGASISNSEIGTAKISNLSVVENADFNGALTVKGGLNVGSDGLYLNGGMAFAGNNTSTLNFTNAALFNSNISGDASNTFVFNASNFSDTSTGYLLSVLSNGSERFAVTAGGVLESGGLNIFGGSTFHNDVDINSGALLLGGSNVSQYFIKTPGTIGQLWQWDGSGGQWVSTSSLGISSGGGGSLPSGTAGQTFVNNGSDWVATSALFIDGSGNVGIGITSGLSNLLSVNGTSAFGATSTFMGALVSTNGLFNSSVANGGGSGGGNLISDPSFETVGTITTSSQPWLALEFGGSTTAFLEVTTSQKNTGASSAYLFAGDSLAILGQTYSTSTNGAAMTLGFYAGSMGTAKVRVLLFGASCGGGGGPGEAYNFDTQTWSCGALDSGVPSSSPYLHDVDVSGLFAAKSVSFIAPATSSILVVFVVGSTDGAYTDQSAFIDDVSLTASGVPNTAFTLNATNFATSSVNDTLLSVQSGGDAKLTLTSGGNLTVGGSFSSAGLFSSSVGNGSQSISHVNLFVNPSFEASPATSSWMTTGDIGGTYQLMTSSVFDGLNAIALHSDVSSFPTSSYELIGQVVSNTLYTNTSTISFYTIGHYGTETARLLVFANPIDSGCSPGLSYMYDFGSNTWGCAALDNLADIPSSTSAVKNFSVNSTSSYQRQSAQIAPISPASTTEINYFVVAGFDHTSYDSQDFAVDAMQIEAGATANTFDNGGGVAVGSYVASTAFILNATNFSTSSISDSLLSIRSGGVEKLNLSSGGALTVGGLNISGSAIFSGVTSFNSTVNISGSSASVSFAGRVLDGDGGVVTLQNAIQVVVHGNYAYAISATTYTIDIFDISNPNNPTYVNTIPNDFISQPKAMTFDGDHLFVASYGSNAIVVYDVSGLPSTVSHVTNIDDNGFGSQPFLKKPTYVYANGGYLYVAAQGNGVDAPTLQIIDASNGSPVGYLQDGMGDVPFLDGVKSIVISGNYLYLASYTNSKLEVVDVTTKSSPTHYSYSDYGGFDSLAVLGNSLIGVMPSADNAIIVYDLSDPTLSTVSSIIYENHPQSGIHITDPTSVAVSGNFAFIGNNTDGSIEVLNMSDPANPTHAGLLEDGTSGAGLVHTKSLFVSGNYLYSTGEIITSTDGMNIFNISGLGLFGTKIMNLSIASSSAFSVGVDGVVRIGTTSTVNTYKLLIDSGSNTNGGIGVNGYIKASGFITGSTTLDLAETYPINENCTVDNSCPEVGDLICTDKGDKLAIKKCSATDQDKILGVVSGNPGMILGGSDLGISSLFSSSTRPIALAGRVPVKVILTTGTIEVGDELTISSSTIGVAEKSTEPGRIVGIALQSFGSTTSTYPQTSTVLMYVNPHYSVGNIQATDISDEFPDFSQTILDKFTLAVKNSLRKLGIIIKEGVLKVKEIFVDRLNTNTLCVGSTCITESQLQDLLNKNKLSPAVVTVPAVPSSTTLDSVTSPASPDNTVSSSSTVSVGSGDSQTVVNLDTTSSVVTNTIVSEQDLVSSPSSVDPIPMPVSEPAVVLPPETPVVVPVSTPAPEVAPTTENAPAPVPAGN